MGNKKKAGKLFPSAARNTLKKRWAKRRKAWSIEVDFDDPSDDFPFSPSNVIDRTLCLEKKEKGGSLETSEEGKVDAVTVLGVKLKEEVSDDRVVGMLINRNDRFVSTNVDGADLAVRTNVDSAGVAVSTNVVGADLTVSSTVDAANPTVKANVNVQGITETNIEGRRIVDIGFMWKEFHRTFDGHAEKTGCIFRDWILINYRRFGFKIQLFFLCQTCGHKDNFWSEPNGEADMDVNAGATLGTVTTGIGFSQLEEFASSIGIPCMAEKTYVRYREKLVKDLESTANREMKLAGEAEKELAIKRGDVHNGIPYISVVADGSWSKRSYGTNYDSLSGVGAIIGHHTGKVLFTGVRNKFCTACDVAQRQGSEPKPHKCYKNFDRMASSTSMESDAIVEGFKSSLETHGLIYKMVVADGDSNVFKAIRDNDPYRIQGVQVVKIECSNHLLRNMCKKIRITSELTQPKRERKRGFVKARDAVKGKSRMIREEVVQAATRWREDKQPYHFRVNALQRELLNICSHVFGEHKHCKCQDQGGLVETNLVPDLTTHGLYQKVSDALEYISCFSDSLLFNLTNNAAESFNAVICKEIGGKRINYGLRDSYNARVAGAAVQYNTQQVVTKYYEGVSKTVPSVAAKLETRRQKKTARTKRARSMKGRKRRFRRLQGLDMHYGPNSQRPDLESEVFKQLQENHLQKLSENAENWKRIECDTRDQSHSELWLTLRKQMLTASNFGPVCRMRPTTLCGRSVKAILYPPISDAMALTYGRNNEDRARKELAVELKKEIRLCGLFVDQEFPFLGASPDGLIDEDGLVEIKCPSTAKDLTAQEAAEALTSMKGVFVKGKPDVMNRKHRYFYQVQGQLHVSQRKYCIFAVWTPKFMKWIRVDRDDVFWDNHMKQFLVRFYNECMLPEIVDSRFNRRMAIRNPEYITKAIKEAALKKEKVVKTEKKPKAQCHLDGQRPTRASRILGSDIVKQDDDCMIAKTGQKLKAQCPIDTGKQCKARKRSAIETGIVEQDDDCMIIGSREASGFTSEEVKRFRHTLDHRVHSITEIRDNVLRVGQRVNDESLDQFLRIVMNKSGFETQSVGYMYGHADLVEPVQSKRSVQLIGGNATDHWRCLSFDGARLRVYDSLLELTKSRFVDEENQYIRLRFPTIRAIDITFEKVQQQPSGVSCGIYAAAFATDVVLGRNPCEVKYSNDEALMRRHFIRIIEDQSLQSFPS